jgi:hypothetical protein
MLYLTIDFKTDAEAQYIAYINELTKGSGSNLEDSEIQPLKKFKEIITSVEYGSVYKIVLNKPQKKNAISIDVKCNLDYIFIRMGFISGSTLVCF